jgi:hypothetical protein
MAEMLLNGTTKNELIGALADQYGEVSENPTGIRIEGDASNFKIVVKKSEGETTISQSGVNYFLNAA